MSHTRGLRILYALFLVNMAVITWQEIKLSASPIGWPRPSRYVGLAVAFSVLGVFAEVASSELAAVVGAGLTIALVIKTVQSGNSQGTVTAPNQPTQTGITGTVQV